MSTGYAERRDIAVDYLADGVAALTEISVVLSGGDRIISARCVEGMEAG